METKRKHSKKREAILNALSEVTDHPTADMLYNRLKPHYPELSLGTVYRNLAVLADEGLLIRVAHVDGQERYDAWTDPHPHFICRKCNRVQDLELPDFISPFYGNVNDSLGCSSESYALTITGVCKDCLAQEQKEVS